MKITKQHILAALAVVTIMFASCGKDGAEVIPRKKLAKIYAEMLVTDQWITSTAGVRQIADTSLVYEPILKKYGYTSEDYRKSVDKYMDDPERFSRIFRRSVEILDDRLAELMKEQARQLALARLPKIEYDFKMEELAPCIVKEAYIHTYDSLDVVRDSATLLFKVTSIERGDTLYEGLRMIVKDSLAVSDSTVVADTLKPDTSKIKPLKLDSLKIREKFISRPKLKLKK